MKRRCLWFELTTNPADIAIRIDMQSVLCSYRNMICCFIKHIGIEQMMGTDLHVETVKCYCNYHYKYMSAHLVSPTSSYMTYLITLFLQLNYNCIVLYCIMRPYTDGPIGPLSYRHSSGVVRNPHSALAE